MYYVRVGFILKNFFLTIKNRQLYLIAYLINLFIPAKVIMIRSIVVIKIIINDF